MKKSTGIGSGRGMQAGNSTALAEKPDHRARLRQERALKRARKMSGLLEAWLGAPSISTKSREALTRVAVEYTLAFSTGDDRSDQTRHHDAKKAALHDLDEPLLSFAKRQLQAAFHQTA